ncbi:MAG: efflux RND transporter periplasmic adaptor subunit [Gammaproteobacteria bacterium]|nr:efflux RND transporter periplasmic adaptor subunit [Gammaproteobacteria bacterium]MCW8841605.1 efflux RND transporter periplasmic adaptor subunit [Gammaproteobacteria bacterium]MCW8927753.1 efflux RND transporter periplasmic adaptor subunit [Gammaproteobacteria bacterium]MCW8972230.1 efflux RND transporter periplasmic adaptor subunit [Gammaproteobacteria bacterium]
MTPGLATAAWDAVVDWAQRTELSTATSGVVESVPVRAGQRVEKGELLLQLKQRALRARVEQGKAALEHGRQLREEAGLELERAEELYARTLLADHDLDLAKIAYAEADASYQLSRARYQEALEALNNSELRAPFTAVVLARRVEPAQTVVTQLRVEPMVILAAADKRLARFRVSAEELADFPLDKTLTVELEGVRHEGRVTSINLEAVAENGSFEVEVLFDADSTTLPGSRAKVSLP